MKTSVPARVKRWTGQLWYTAMRPVSVQEQARPRLDGALINKYRMGRFKQLGLGDHRLAHGSERRSQAASGEIRARGDDEHTGPIPRRLLHGVGDGTSKAAVPWRIEQARMVVANSRRTYSVQVEGKQRIDLAPGEEHHSERITNQIGRDPSKIKRPDATPFDAKRD